MYRDMRRRVHGRVVWPVRRVRRVRCPWWVRVLLTTFGCNFSAITEQVLCGVVSFDGPLTQSCPASGGCMHVATLNAFPHATFSFRWPPPMGCVRLHQPGFDLHIFRAVAVDPSFGPSDGRPTTAKDTSHCRTGDGARLGAIDSAEAKAVGATNWAPEAAPGCPKVAGTEPKLYWSPKLPVVSVFEKC